MATPSPAASSVSERRAFRVGLTGGIGSGKSLVADLLAGHGAAIIDTDAIAHRLTAPGGSAIAAIRERFGAQYVDASGALDRARMRARVFADDSARRELEAILHPLIRALADAQAAADRAAPYLVLAVPLLVESGDWSTRVDRVLLVDCPAHAQVRRVVQTRGLAREEVESIIARQASRAQRLAAADDVIVNAGARTQIAPRVARLHAHYCALAAAHADRGRAQPL
jgi:dephospho-CoA kinase